MLEFLELLSNHFNENFPVLYYGVAWEDMAGGHLLLSLICDYFDGDMLIKMYEENYEDPNWDIEYRAWDYNRTGIRETA